MLVRCIVERTRELEAGGHWMKVSSLELSLLVSTFGPLLVLTAWGPLPGFLTRLAG